MSLMSPYLWQTTWLPLQTISRPYPSSQRPTSIAYATEDDPFTQPQVDTARALFEQEGIKTASYQVYPAETTDYNPIADKIIASGAQVVVVGTLLPDVSAFIQRFKQQHYNPQALIATAGPDQGDQFTKAIGGPSQPKRSWYPMAAGLRKLLHRQCSNGTRVSCQVWWHG